MKIVERVARFSDRVFDRLRDKDAFTLTDAGAVTSDFESLRGQTYAVVVTFRRNGEAVPSPVWIAIDDNGNAYLKTRHDAGKVKRVRNDPRVVIAASTLRGRAKGPAVKGTARILPSEEWAHAEELLAAAYGGGRKISEGLLGGPDDSSAYIEVVPGR